MQWQLQVFLVLVANVGPQEFVQTMSYVQHLSNICSAYDQTMSKSYFWPEFVLQIQLMSSPNPVFVLEVQLMTSLCHLTWSKLTKILEDKIWSKIWHDNFSICHLVTFLPDISWRFSGLTKINHLSSFCRGLNSLRYVCVPEYLCLGQVMNALLQILE